MSRFLYLFCVALLWGISPAQAQEGRNYAVLIGGLGGQASSTEAFKDYLHDTRQALIEHLQFLPEHVTVLGENAIQGEAYVDGPSLAEHIRATFATLAQQATPDDHLYVILFGHGSYNGTHAQLNIPRRDLTDADYDGLLSGIQADRIVFINTASASSPFIDALSGPGRIIITATRSGTQRNETTFPRFLVDALVNPAADLDKNRRLSVQELFVYAAEETARSFEDAGHLATEHPLLDDTGDGSGARVEEVTMDSASEGQLAAVTYLQRQPVLLADAGPATSQQQRDREDLERQIAELKSRKTEMDIDAYYAALEVLFIQLARLNETIETQ